MLVIAIVLSTNIQQLGWIRRGLGSVCLCQRFHHLGLIETNKDRFIIIKENSPITALRSL